MTDNWKTPSPEQVLNLFDESKSFMRHYLDQIKYEVIESDAPFQIGDLVCYHSLMWGMIPAKVAYVRPSEIACILIDNADRCSAWQKVETVKHICLKKG